MSGYRPTLGMLQAMHALRLGRRLEEGELLVRLQRRGLVDRSLGLTAEAQKILSRYRFTETSHG